MSKHTNAKSLQIEQRSSAYKKKNPKQKIGDAGCSKQTLKFDVTTKINSIYADTDFKLYHTHQSDT